MLHDIAIWLGAAAFLGAGVVNALAAPAQRGSFARWGYPTWWCRATGALEIATAVLIAFPVTHWVGLGIGALIVAAAIATVVRHRDPGHLMPLGLFAALLVLNGI